MISELQRWLDTVTGVFPHDTAARLRRELEAHAEESAQTLQAEGHPDAEAAALHALGDAREVRRRLEETHFTRAEVEWLRQDSATRRALEGGFYPRGWWTAFLVLSYVFLFSVPLINWHIAGVFTWVSTLGYWAFGAAFVLAERWVVRQFSRVSSVILWRVLGLLSLPLWLMLTQVYFGNTDGDWSLIMFQGLVVCVGICLFRPRAALALLPKALRNAA